MGMPEHQENQDDSKNSNAGQDSTNPNSSGFDNPLRDPEARKAAEPCQVVIFGASGDLTGRKLLPALHNLQKDNLLSENTAITGFARREKSNEDFRKESHDQIKEFSRSDPDEESINHFTERLYYHQSNFDDDAGYQSLDKFLKDLDKQYNTGGNRLFYLSVQSHYFLPIVEKLSKNGLIQSDPNKKPWTRVIIEKPFGRDLESAEQLQKDLTQYLREDQIYRIDHYLGKETVQNLMIFRFTNPIFESIWNYKHIDNVQITFSEDIGIGEKRGPTYEQSGLCRDILQNHLTQVLSIVAMEPPSSLDAEAIRDEKVKVVQSIRHYQEHEILKNAVRGQYTEGFVNGEQAIGYRKEERVDPNSNVETFGAMRLYVDNWRWSNVPFFIRAGKRLVKRSTEIIIEFKKAPPVLFFKNASPTHNRLIIRLQPDEGVSLQFDVKVPGSETTHQPLTMDFRYSDYFSTDMPEAYERLIHDCMIGDATLFARYDEVYWSWQFYSPIVHLWENTPLKSEEFYQAGTMGPSASDMLLYDSGHKWVMI